MRRQLRCTGDSCGNTGFTAILFETHFDVPGVKTLHDTRHYNIRKIWKKLAQKAKVSFCRDFKSSCEMRKCFRIT